MEKDFKKECQLNREEILKDINRHEKVIDKHGDRIIELERHQSKVEVQIANLIADIRELIKMIKTGLGAMLASGLGFIIWYIQSLSG